MKGERRELLHQYQRICHECTRLRHFCRLVDYMVGASSSALRLDRAQSAQALASLPEAACCPSSQNAPADGQVCTTYARQFTGAAHHMPPCLRCPLLCLPCPSARVQVGESLVRVGMNAARDLLSYFADTNKARVGGCFLSPHSFGFESNGEIAVQRGPKCRRSFRPVPAPPSPSGLLQLPRHPLNHSMDCLSADLVLGGGAHCRGIRDQPGTNAWDVDWRPGAAHALALRSTAPPLPPPPHPSGLLQHHHLLSDAPQEVLLRAQPGRGAWACGCRVWCVGAQGMC